MDGISKQITSIIMTHWGQNELRSNLLRTSLESLIITTKHLPVEIIVIDNGGRWEDSMYLLEKVQAKEIQHYVRNSENLYFGWGRNVGYSLSSGDTLVFSDNDIEYKQGWLDKCLAILNAHPDKKIAVTPLRTDRQHRNDKQWAGTLEINGEFFLMNRKAGSNSWVIRRKDFEEIGKFRNHVIAGSKWTDDFVNKGYLMVTMEKEPMAKDLGFKHGYNFKMNVDIKKIFANGEELIINN